jgi:tRNA (mo5U34)-methyltransferase
MKRNGLDREELRGRIKALEPWFHNLKLYGMETAPDHFLGDYPSFKWRSFQNALPADLSDKSVLDIGCNGGFYSLEMKRRGARRVVAIDFDERYLAQARLAADVLGEEIEFHNLSVYDVEQLGERFDIVLFMGVLYHLRHPLLALDLIHEHVAGDVLVFQSMLRGSDTRSRIEQDYSFHDSSPFGGDGYPVMYFVEHRYAGDPTNWWIPNAAAAEAMLRSAGFVIEAHPESEVYVCRRASLLA